MFYDPWMFKKNPSFKVKIGQILARLSLILMFGKLLKTIFPYAYVRIIKCLSNENEIAGMMRMYHFKKSGNKKYSVVESKVVFDKFQGKKLSGFMTEAYLDTAKKEKVGLIVSITRVDNKNNIQTYQKYGWKYNRKIKKGMLIRGNWYDGEEWIREI